MRVALLSDTQFDEYVSLSTILPNGITSRLQDQLDALAWVAKDAQERGCTELITLGDVFDSRVELNLSVIDKVCRAYHRIAEEGMKLRFLVGNHDAYLRNSAMNSLQVFRGYAEVLDTPTVVGPFAFLPWVDDVSLIQAAVQKLAADKKAKYLFMHGIVQGAVHASVKGIPLVDLMPTRWTQVFLGDVHTPTQMAPNVNYVGAFMQLEFGDAASFRGYVVLDTETGTFERIENTVSPRFHILGGRNKSVGDIRNCDFVSVEIDDPIMSAEVTAAVRKKAGWVRSRAVEVTDAPPRIDIRVTQGVMEVLQKYCAYQGLEADTALLELGASFVQTSSTLVSQSAAAGLMIAETHGVNFGPFVDFSYDFSQPGLTTLEGRIDNVQGCEGNGAGKSYMLDLPIWVLFGRCLRPDYAGDDIIRHGATYAMGTVHIRGGSDDVVVERYRKHPQFKDMVRLFVGGKDVTRGTNQQTQEAIVAVLGADFLSVMNSVAYGTREDVRSFFSSTDTDRKAVLEKIFGLEVYSDALQTAQEALAQAKDECAIHADAVTDAERERYAAVAVLESLVDAAPEEVEEAQQALVTARANSQKVQKRKKTVQQKVGALETQLDDAAQAYAAKLAVHRVAKTTYTLEYDKLTTARADASAQVRAEEAEQVARKNRIAAATARTGTACPTCEQDVPHTHTEGIIKGLEGAMTTCTQVLKKLNTKREAANTALSKLEAPQAPVDEISPPIRLELATLNQELKSMTEIIRQAQREEESCEARIAGFDQQADVRKDAEAAVVNLNDLWEKAKEAVHGYTQRVDQCTFWVAAFGNKGLKSFLLEAEIPEVNRRASVYAQRLLGAGATVRLSATRTLKTKGQQREELTVTGSIPRLTTSYAGASKGQKRRMDLALLLAFRDIMASRSTRSFKQLFADELFDGVDKAGCETVVGVLKEIAKECPVLLVTHDPRLKSAGDQSILVHHNGETAQLVAYSAKTATTPRMKARRVS